MVVDPQMTRRATIDFVEPIDYYLPYSAVERKAAVDRGEESILFNPGERGLSFLPFLAEVVDQDEEKTGQQDEPGQINGGFHLRFSITMATSDSNSRS
jgi:hypothetical protein